MQVADQIQKVKSLVEDYYNKSLEWDSNTPVLSDQQKEHVIQIGTSILCTKWKIGYPGGSFVQAVVDNNLMQAVGRADGTNVKMLPFYCKLIYNVGMPMELAGLVK